MSVGEGAGSDFLSVPVGPATFGKRIGLPGRALAFPGSLIELRGQLAVEPGEVHPAGFPGAAALLHGPGAEIVGIVGHDA